MLPRAALGARALSAALGARAQSAAPAAAGALARRPAPTPRLFPPRSARALSAAPAAADALAPPGAPPSATSATCSLIDSAARSLFAQAWAAQVAKRGGREDALVFPRELIFLTGAPGAGKGTQIGAILRERDIQHAVEVSSLFKTPAFEAAKATGRLLSDADVVGAVLDELLDAKYDKGAVVDGFPRTAAQASAIVLLHEKLSERCAAFAGAGAAARAATRRPRITLSVFWCDEAESVARQLRRGAGAQRAASIAREIGLRAGEAARTTDLDEERARLRYAVFKAEVAACMAVAKDVLRTVFIDASGPPDAVAARTRESFRYSAALDLDPSVYELLRPVRSAKALVRSARSELVARLSAYAAEQPELLAATIEVMQRELMPIIARQALSGHALIRSSNDVFAKNRAAVNMALDVLTERGFTVYLDIEKTYIPSHVEDGKIVSREARVLAFHVSWTKPDVRASAP